MRLRNSLTDFQSFSGGGAMATAEAVNYSYEIRLTSTVTGHVTGAQSRSTSCAPTPPVYSPDPADIDYEEITRTGWWQNSEMKIRKEGED